MYTHHISNYTSDVSKQIISYYYAGYIVTYVMSVHLSVQLLLGTLDLVAFIVLLQH